MAGEAPPPLKPPSQNQSSSAVKLSSSHRSNSQLESSTPKTPNNPKPSTSVPVGTQKTNPTSNKTPSTITTAKPLTPKVKPNPSPNLNNPSLRFDPPVSKLPPFPFLDPPPPPAYGFHMLDRGTIVLSDGSVRSYFALPRDYQDFPVMPRRPGQGFGFGRPLPVSPEFRGLGIVGERDDRFRIDGRGVGPGPGDGSGNILKRKFGDDEINERDGYERQRQKLLQYGSAGGSGEGISVHSNTNMGRGEQTSPPKYTRPSDGGNFLGLERNEVDQSSLKKAFLHFIKTIYENTSQKKKYLADGKQGSLSCLACGRSTTKGFMNMHELVVHAYSSKNADSNADHLGFYKALCVLMGWNYRSPPDNSKIYQFLPADEAMANQEDLIMWPPLVIIHNTLTGKGFDRMEGMGNRAMDSYIRDLGIGGGKSKSMYSKEGHLGITLIKFTGDQSGLKEAVKLTEIFARENRERNAWARVGPVKASIDDERNPHLVKVDERTGEKRRIFYGHLATVVDMETIDSDTRKKITIKSMRELKLSN